MKHWFLIGIMVDFVAMMGLILIAVLVDNTYVKVFCACMAGLVCLDFINGVEIRFGDVFNPGYWIDKYKKN